VCVSLFGFFLSFSFVLCVFLFLYFFLKKISFVFNTKKYLLKKNICVFYLLLSLFRHHKKLIKNARIFVLCYLGQKKIFPFFQNTNIPQQMKTQKCSKFYVKKDFIFNQKKSVNPSILKKINNGVS
jgi:hypothetical protein